MKARGATLIMLRKMNINEVICINIQKWYLKYTTNLENISRNCNSTAGKMSLRTYWDLNKFLKTCLLWIHYRKILLKCSTVSSRYLNSMKKQGILRSRKIIKEKKEKWFKKKCLQGISSLHEYTKMHQCTIKRESNIF